MTASVLLDLDTTAPTFRAEMPLAVSSPEDMVITVVANEDIGEAWASLVDDVGEEVSLAGVLLDSRTLLVTVPTVGLAAGPSTLFLTVSDVVANSRRQQYSVRIDRPEVFDVEITVSGTMDTLPMLDGVYEIDVEVQGCFDLALDLDAPYRGAVEVDASYEIAMEIY